MLGFIVFVKLLFFKLLACFLRRYHSISYICKYDFNYVFLHKSFYVMIFLFAIVITFTLGFLATPLLIGFLKKMELVDNPGGRKIHQSQIPSMGGLVFVVALLCTAFVLLDPSQLLELRYVLAAVTLVFFVGLRDDMVDLTPMQKLGGQMVGTIMVVVLSDLRISSFYGFLGIYELPLVVSYLLSVFSIIALTNAFNLIDGLDGLAGSISVIVFSFLAWWFIQAGFPSYGLFSLMMVGGVLSFLCFNWHPAKIFMGDTGSLTLGFSLSVMVIAFIDANGNLEAYEGLKFEAPLATGIALMIIPIYDTARIFYRRVRKGKSPFAPDKNHVHHFLMRMGLSHDKVSALLSGVLLFFIALVLLGNTYSDHVMVPLVLLSAIILGLRMDAVTLKYVKRKAKSSPRVLQSRTRVKLKPVIDQNFKEEIRISKN